VQPPHQQQPVVQPPYQQQPVVQPPYQQQPMVQPPYQQQRGVQPPYQQQPGVSWPNQPPPPTTKRQGRGKKGVGVLMMVFGICPLLGGVGITVNTYLNSRIQIHNDAFGPVAWHNLRTDEVFPDVIDNPRLVKSQPRAWSRQGMAEETSCEVFRADLAKAAISQGCKTALRATYVHSGGEMVATIAVGVLDSPGQMQDTAHRLNDESDKGFVDPVAVPGTPAARWNKKLAISGGVTALDPLPYIVAVTIGPLDSRRTYDKLPGQWESEARAERTTYWKVSGELLSDYVGQFGKAATG